MSDEKTTFNKAIWLPVIAAVVLSTIFGFTAGVVGSSGVAERLVGSSNSKGKTAVGTPTAGRARLANAAFDGANDEPFIGVVERVAPAVVSITVSKNMPVMEQYMADPFAGDPFFQQFFGGSMQMPQYRQNGTKKQEVGAGTGFLVSADGYIITNRHVVSDAEAEYEVAMADKKTYPAKVIARDTANDIAVVKIEGTGFPTVKLGDSDSLKVGQRTVAIGNALGQYDNTVSQGIISGLRRRLQAGDGQGSVESLYDVIQTDAAINPGNSGGPLLNLSGEAVGVNVAMAQGSQSIGFALPINDVRRVYDSVRKTGKIARPWLGVRFTMIDKEIKEANQLTVDEGALVVRGEKPTDLAVAPGSPADLAGIVENDIILEANGVKLTAEYPLNVAAGKLGVGDTLKLKVLHKGQTRTVEVKLGEREAAKP
jgi:serine protease Do